MRGVIMTTLQDAIAAIGSIKGPRVRRKTSIAKKLLGKFKGMIPPGMTSTRFIRELRDGSYGKFK